MKILFLDINGVLSPVHWERLLFKMWKSSRGKIKSKDDFGKFFFNQNVDALNKIIEETGCTIVISSTWRKMGIDKLREMWSTRNIPGVISGITPFISYRNRGVEIQSYLSDTDDIGKYAIVDNKDIEGHDDSFVKTNEYYGLTMEDADKIINILNS
jgi:hypothetical protein